MQVQLDSTTLLSSNKSSAQVFRDSRHVSSKERPSFAEVLERSTNQVSEREVSDHNADESVSSVKSASESSPETPLKSTSSPTERSLGEDKQESNLSDADSSLVDNGDVKEIKEQASDLKSTDESVKSTSLHTDGKSLPKDEASLGLDQKEKSIITDVSSIEVPFEQVVLNEGDLVNPQKIIDPATSGSDSDVVLDTDNSSDVEASPILEGVPQLEASEYSDEVDVVHLTLSGDDNASASVEENGSTQKPKSLDDFDGSDINLNAVIPPKTTLDEKLESLSLTLTENTINPTDENVEFKGEGIDVETLETDLLQIKNPIKSEDVEVDANSRTESIDVNLAWILGEMKKQDSSGLKQSANLVDEGGEAPLVLNPQNTLFTKLNATFNSSSKLDGSINEGALSLSPDLVLDTKLKGGSKEPLPELSLSTDLSLDESLSIEPADLLKNSKLFDSHIESLANTDTKSVTPLTSALGVMTGPSLSLASQGGQVSNQSSLTMTVPPNDPNWAQEMGEKVRWIMREGVQTAEIHLDPPELGSLAVKVSLDGDVASVSFSAATPQVRDLLESHLQRLREQLAQQGVELTSVDVNVSQQKQDQGTDSSGGQGGGNDPLVGEEDALIEENTSYVSASGVDYYA